MNALHIGNVQLRTVDPSDKMRITADKINPLRGEISEIAELVGW